LQRRVLASCQIKKKLHLLPGDNRTIFTITGNSTFYPAPPTNADLEAWLQTAKPIISGDYIISNFFTKAGDAFISLSALESCGASLSNEFEGFFTQYPSLRFHYSGQELCRPVLVQYDAKVKDTIIGSYLIRLATNGTVIADGYTLDHNTSSDQRRIWRYGEQHYVDDNVLRAGSVGVQFLGPDFQNLWNGPTLVKDMLPENAARISAQLIHATEEASRIVPIKNAVGGTPVIMLIDGKSMPKQVN
jgi:hypothetical protein